MDTALVSLRGGHHKFLRIWGTKFWNYNNSFAASVDTVFGERKVRPSTRVVLRSPDIGANVTRWVSSKLNNVRDLGGLNFHGVL